MLTRIKIRNIALLEKADLSFKPGLSGLTGETGAGKSIIVTSLSLALGGRAEQEYIRHGSDTASVEAIFDVSRMPDTYKNEFTNIISNNTIKVHRTVSRGGGSRVSINGSRASLGELKTAMVPIAEILGQHANLMLMNEDNHIIFLDRFGHLTEQAQSLAKVYTRWRSAADQLRQIQNQQQQLQQERELFLFQKDEIEKAQLRIGEEEELLTERKVLDSARSLMSSAAMIVEILDGEENAALNLLLMARGQLNQMSYFDPSLEKMVQEIDDLCNRTEEMREYVEQYGASVEDNPARIEEINIRLDELYNIRKKYGGSEEAALKTLKDITAKLKKRPDVKQLITDLEHKSDRLHQKYSEQAVNLSKNRHRAAAKLQKMVTRELDELAIENACYEVAFQYDNDPDGIILDDRTVRPYEQGLEKARFVFSANPGEPLKPLVKTASGGEISRVLLALKAAEKKNGKLTHSLLVFDEVDAGIGGKTATEVGRKLRKLANDCQLIVVTHLHQIARQVDHHFVAEKTKNAGNRNVITVRQLDSDGIKCELDRMVALPEET
ncbi:MAG: DNA repair protein RecN [candidate division Zixibacteria bacterium]|nr:DNA repair protein RecN [candidate division Zixibacteria bacterium]